MICENCGERPACVHTKITVNGQTTEKMLCAQCWQKESGNITQPFTLSDLFKGIVQPGSAQSAASVCPACGTDLRAVQKTGQLGCPDCYAAFEDEIRPSLIKIHGKDRHEGKRPVGYAAKEALRPFAPPKDEKRDAQTGDKGASGSAPDKPAEAKTDIDALKARLLAAIEAEDYESAAALRDEIRSRAAQSEVDGNG